MKENRKKEENILHEDIDLGRFFEIIASSYQLYVNRLKIYMKLKMNFWKIIEMILSSMDQ